MVRAMRLPARIGRLAFGLCVALAFVAWVAICTWSPVARDEGFWSVWISMALLLNIAVVLRVRDLGRSCWWSVPGWLLYPMSAWLGVVTQEATPHGPSMGWVSWSCYWVYVAGAGVVPISFVFLVLAPGTGLHAPGAGHGGTALQTDG